MKAVRIHQHGGTDCLVTEDIPIPEYQPTEVLVRVHAAALNHLDIWIREGLPGVKLPLPLILGSDMAGEVVEVGSQVRSVAVGMQVMVQPGIGCRVCRECLSGNDSLCSQYKILGENINGGQAEYIVLQPDQLIPKPEHLSYPEAAAFPLVFLTAWNMLVNKCQLSPDDTVLIVGANSGVGSAGIQIAKALGARVYATAGDEEKMEKAHQLGAEQVINHYSDDYAKVIRQLTEKSGVDIVFDHVGEATWEKSLQCLKKGGKLVTCGATTGYQVGIDLRFIFFKQQQIIGSTMGSRADLLRATELLERRQLKPVVDKVFPLEDVEEAHKYLEDSKQFGKVVLQID